MKRARQRTRSTTNPTEHRIQSRDSASYLATNWIVLLASIYCLLLPVIHPRVQSILPERFHTCAAPRVCGRPCPLCGMTRAMERLETGDFEAARSMHPLVFPAAILIGIEIVARITIILTGLFGRIPKEAPRLDAAAHLLLLLSALAYSAVFMLGPS